MSARATLGRTMLAEPDQARRALQAAAAEDHLIDFIRFAWPVLEPGRELIEGWALHAVCDHLEAVHRGDIDRLIINVPPGCMKSLNVNVFFPCWEWGPRNEPYRRHINASYAERLSIRDTKKARRVIQDPLYQEFWGNRFKLTSDANAKSQFDNDKTGFMLATSVAGVGTGERADRFKIDDPHNVKEAESDAKREAAVQWLAETVATRTNDESSAFILIMQRVHENDCSGHLIASELGWDHLCLPMRYEEDHPYPTKTTVDFIDPRTEDGELLWPELFPESRVDRDEKLMKSWGGDYAVAGQNQQRPTPRGGGMFKEEDWRYVDQAPEKAKRVRGWDLAATDKKENKAAAYTVGVLMSKDTEGRIYIEDVARDQVNDLGVELMLKSNAAKDGKSTEQSIPQDPGAAGKTVRSSQARLLHGYKVHFSLESGDKETRAVPLSAQVAAGNVYLVRGPWNRAFVKEAASFPKGRLKDQVDGASRAYGRLIGPRKQSWGAAPEVVD